MNKEPIAARTLLSIALIAGGAGAVAEQGALIAADVVPIEVRQPDQAYVREEEGPAEFPFDTNGQLDGPEPLPPASINRDQIPNAFYALKRVIRQPQRGQVSTPNRTRGDIRAFRR